MATRQLPGATMSPAFNSMATTYKTAQERSPPVSAAGTEENPGDILLQPLLSPRATSLQHVEVMERLKQLMAWQDRQKASLLRQQQEQIMQLHQRHHVSEQQLEKGDGKLFRFVARK